ncbi:MAG TPA: DUF488 domain-containing protein [Candidatus Paceibacterota bacterium]|nr:DUF488 domain-containing protein [Candidatus Paceibacterota bacterium]
MKKQGKPELWTIGHSNRSLEEFAALLEAHGIEAVADVRSIPASRHNPQFAQKALERALKRRGIEYRWLEALGGRRRARKDSPNLGWHNASFRGYADYMQGLEFAAGLAELEKYAKGKRVAIMCAEAVPWRCHRSMIGDALLARGWRVLDITSASAAKPHKKTPFLKIRRGALSYPGPQAPLW